MSFVIKPFEVHLCGPFGIHGYGLTLLVALVVFCLLLYKKLQKIYPLSFETASALVVKGIVVGIIGGRLVYSFFDWDFSRGFFQIFEVWSGGLSILGSVIAVCIYMPFELRRKKIALFPAFDVAAVYAPVAHAIGRLGCLWAGCCFGCQTTGSCAVVYQGITAGAQINIPLMPVQLYSAGILFVLFLVLRVALPVLYKKMPGALLLLYVIGISLERFATDFWRNDRQAGFLPFFSYYQWIALFLAGSAFLLLIGLFFDRSKRVGQKTK